MAALSDPMCRPRVTGIIEVMSRQTHPEEPTNGLNGHNPTTDELVRIGAPYTLRDGSPILVRQGHHSDRKLLLDGFARLSPESRYRRFLVPMPELREQTIEYLLDVDHHDHEAMVAIDPQTGQGIGVARYVRDKERPDAAEVAATVVDEWQGRGVGTLLLEVIGERARAEGITTFTASMLATNREMLDVLQGLGPFEVVDRELGCVEVEAPIATEGVSPILARMLKAVAREELKAREPSAPQAFRLAGFRQPDGDSSP
jgi:GNAT superfamily N-acetyltransferase